jgi:phosphoenolpyruvate synthase/pyruvate phosphate dikinase
MAMAEHILPLDAAATRPQWLVGGKARGFATLTGAGLPVPDGFVITTLAHRAANGAVRVPAGLAGAIAEALDLLGDDPMAVRSSACGEDGAEHSFAGQYATILGARGSDEVLAAVAECWRSAGDARALAYRDHVDGGVATSMAEIVQRLVQPTAAGIAFTADPVTGDRETVVVNASYGLGEAVVSGVVTPDDYRLSRADGQILRLEIGDKDVMLHWDGGTVREIAVPDPHRAARALDDDALAAVHRGALACEEALGRPVDCEFCVADDRVTWVQCRPLTALPEPTRSTPA